MNKTKGLFFTASLVLALTLTQSCSGDDNSGGGGNSVACTDLEEVPIGSQIWAKKNLDCDIAGSKCLDNNTANCTEYGRLYNLETAKTACPSGWHLPDAEEWEILVDFVGGENAGDKLKATSGWKQNRNGTDDYGFSALPGGYGFPNGSFAIGDVGNFGYWWSSFPNSGLVWTISYNGAVYDDYDFSEARLASVRCIKD